MKMQSKLLMVSLTPLLIIGVLVTLLVKDAAAVGTKEYAGE